MLDGLHWKLLGNGLVAYRCRSAIRFAVSSVVSRREADSCRCRTRRPTESGRELHALRQHGDARSF